MRILIVEDEPARVESIMPQLIAAFGNDAVVLSEDRDSALREIEAHPFDLVVLDQRIPSSKNQLDPDVQHGRAVFDVLRQSAPHTAVFFLTGLPMEDDYVDHLIAEGNKCDIFGDRNPISLVRKFQKSSLAPFFAQVEAIAATAKVTTDIELNTKGADFAISDIDQRLIRSFTRMHGGICADIEILNDGLSGARVMKVDVKDDGGGVRLSAASKIGRHESIDNELERYDREVQRLPAGTYAPQVTAPAARVLGNTGAFYRLLTGFDHSLFDVLRRDDHQAAACVASLKRSQEPWFTNRSTRKMPIVEVLEMLVWKDRLALLRPMLAGLNWEAYEQREITVVLCTRHGDLHGENARVADDGRVMMLDYGAVEVLPSAIDPVTLELSPFFHPHGCREVLNWSPSDGEFDWFDKEKFKSTCKVPHFVEATRSWAHEQAFGNREVLACAYVYIVRQLQFPKVEKELALAMLSGLIRRGLET